MGTWYGFNRETKNHQWGSHFLEQFSHDMRQAFPEMHGGSKRNLEYMQ
ncbi:TPA: DUF1016 domain-containing protein [Legionella pneumophila]|nr:DUF1016 domain-containing protein [Legionella pneumophila]HAU2265418.1 DUF1016 domain-containing protein [Legionella pneumophila]